MKDLSTENKIKEAARKIFTQKGYAATRTRDIAEEAGINLALLNYYFRSKKKLFDIVMLERVDELFGIFNNILSNKPSDRNIDEIIKDIIDMYYDMLIKNPDLPLFVLNEINNNLENSEITNYLKEIFEKLANSKLLERISFKTDPMVFIINFIGLIIFPFISKQIHIAAGIMKEDHYDNIIQAQKELIPEVLKYFIKDEK
ncbi:MAG: TetR/AcrR family transcriptional regulator [Bacteroidales bacterium]|nr:TetR/AcrR family transcriptional regulator [Bacteroidales bacterium]